MYVYIYSVYTGSIHVYTCMLGMNQQFLKFERQSAGPAIIIILKFQTCNVLVTKQPAGCVHIHVSVLIYV